MSSVVSKFSLKAFFLLLFILLISKTSAVETVRTAQFTANTKSLDLISYLEILPDPEHRLNFNDIKNANQGNNFQPVSIIGNSFGFSKSVYWIHFSLKVDEIHKDSLLLQLEYPLIDNVTLFVPTGQGEFVESSTGDTLPFSKRELESRTFLFHIPVHGGERHHYYMRLQTNGSMLMPLSLWTHDAFFEHTNTINLIFGGYYAIMLILMIAALVAFIKIRDNLFLFYAVYLMTYLLFQFSLNGFSYQYLWPESPWFNSRATSAFIGLVVIGGVLFSGSFLQIWGEKHRYIKRLFHLLLGAGFFSVFLSLFGDYELAVKVSVSLGLILPPIVLAAIISALSIGYRPARYFLGAWSIFLIGVFIAALLQFGLLPSNFLTLYAMQIGSTLEIILLGYALLDRIDLLRIEKVQAREEANKYLVQLNEKLESLVRERTKNLEEKNNELSQLAIHDGMTGLLNHKAAIDFLTIMHQASERYGHDLSVIMLDIDFFKAINDQYGHQAGDIVIISIADILTQTIRESDGCGRYGGEEFILILPETNGEKAYELAERIRKNIMQLNIAEIDNNPVSVSFGISVFDPLVDDADLLSQADKALYKAKQSGRNTVILAH